MTRRLDLFKVLRRRNEEYLEMPIYRFVTPHLLINLCLTPFSFSVTKGDLVAEILSLVNTYPRGEVCLSGPQIELIFAAADILDVDFRDALRMELKDAKPIVKRDERKTFEEHKKFIQRIETEKRTECLAQIDKFMEGHKENSKWLTQNNAVSTIGSDLDAGGRPYPDWMETHKIGENMPIKDIFTDILAETGETK